MGDQFRRWVAWHRNQVRVERDISMRDQSLSSSFSRGKLARRMIFLPSNRHNSRSSVNL